MEDSVPQRGKYLLQIHSVQWSRVWSQDFAGDCLCAGCSCAKSKFPEAEYEELVLRVGYSDLLVQLSVGSAALGKE